MQMSENKYLYQFNNTFWENPVLSFQNVRLSSNCCREKKYKKVTLFVKMQKQHVHLTAVEIATEVKSK